MRQRTERIGSYSGPAKVVVDGEVVAAGRVNLTAQKVVIESTSMGGGMSPVDGATSWTGTIYDVDMGALFGHSAFLLRLPDGREGEAFLRHTSGQLACSGEPPFDVS